ncbi:hypothetical protein HYX58_02950 [Candidatus Dependentiae bacterium]|nr:hypothetical protein [Candidatus Dependentiae bacterium]
MKKLLLSFILLLLHQGAIYSMENNNNAAIKGAAYYLNSGTSVSFHDKEGTYLKRFNYKIWNADQQKKFDSMIDTQSPKLEITSAEIREDQLFGRRLFYKDKNGDYLVCTTYDGGSGYVADSYRGPIDIKKATKYHHSLIQPSSLLNNIKSVKEDGIFFSMWLFPPYLKKELIYKEDGGTTERSTRKHQLYLGTQLACGLGLLYACYKCYTNYFPLNSN